MLLLLFLFSVGDISVRFVVVVLLLLLALALLNLTFPPKCGLQSSPKGSEKCAYVLYLRYYAKNAHIVKLTCFYLNYHKLVFCCTGISNIQPLLLN